MKTPTISRSSPASDLRLKPVRSVLRKTLFTLVPFLASAALSHATLLLNENFDDLTAGSLNGQDGWTANADLNVVPGGLSYTSGDITLSGGANHVQSSVTSPDAATPLATNSFDSQSGDVWMSFTMVVNNSANNDRYWFWLSDTTSINSGFTAAVGDASTSSKNLVAETRINTTSIDSSQVGIADGQVIFVVARLSKDGGAANTDAYDRVELWVNPDSTSLGSASATADRSNPSFTAGVLNFRLTVLGTPTLQWDNLLVGTTQADVLDVYATIPEPAVCAALGGLAALGLALTLRRRRA